MDYVKVILQDGSCYECGDRVIFRRPDKWDEEHKPYSWEYPFEVPASWLERWEAAEKAYEDAQVELRKILDLKPGQNRISHDASL